MSSSTRAFAWSLLAAAAACRAPVPREETSSPRDPSEVLAAPAPAADGAPEVRAGGERSELRAIAQLEDQRKLHDGALLAYLAHASPAVRARAATAVGRVRHRGEDPKPTAALVERLADPDAAVRASAAFALGLRGDPAACPALLELAARESDVLVRARAVEAASKLDPADALAEYWKLLQDPAPEVRLEVVRGASRWKRDAPGASAIDAVLVEHALRERDARVRTSALFALERRKSPHARAACLASANAEDVEERLFAMRGLAHVELDAELDAVLIARSRDGDWRVAYEALHALARSPRLPALEAMAAASAHESHHVRAVALQSATAQIAAFETAGLLWKTEGLGKFERILEDPSPAVRAAAVPNLLRHSSWDPLESTCRHASLSIL